MASTSAATDLAPSGSETQIPNVLYMLVTEEVAKAAFDGYWKIKESDLEVINFNVTTEEYELLLSKECNELFEKDAILSIQANYASMEKKGIILACYTKTKAKYWLLNCSTLVNCPISSIYVWKG